MRLGLGSYACSWAVGVPGYDVPGPFGAIGLIRRAKALGLGVAQIADNIPLETCTRGDIAQIRDAARDAGIEIELGTRGIAPAHLRRFLEIGREFSAKLLRVVVDLPNHHPSPGAIVETVRGLIPDLLAAEMVLGIENHDRFNVRTLSDIMQRIESPAVGICLDTVNSFGSLEGPEVVVNTLAPFVVNLHLKDFIVRRASHMMGFEITGAPAGQGQLNIPWLLQQLRAAGRDPNAILELWPPPEPDLATTIAKEAEWCASSVRYLRTLIPN